MNSILDDALERLRGMGPEAVHGAPNHGPMAAEALVALGCRDEVPRWTDDYRGELSPMPQARLPVTETTWHEALGAVHRIGDWQSFFVTQLAEASWHTVFVEWMRRLIPGLMAGGTHGLIRTAHAVRALSEAVTPLRVEELASALAYWAAYYQALPGVPQLRGALDLDGAIERVPRIGRGQQNEWRREGVPREFVRILIEYPDFAAAVDRLGTTEPVDAAFNRLTEAGARLYLANASTHPLVFIHALTGPAAVRLLLPHMPSALREVAFAYCWQAVAAWVATYDSDAAGAPDDSAPPSEAEIAGRAVGTRDHHAIKFAEASLREYRLNPRSVYLKAAADAPPHPARRGQGLRPGRTVQPDYRRIAVSDSPNVAVVRRLYQARGNPEVIRQVLASDVRWEVVEGFPHGAVYVGLDSVLREFFGRLFADFDEFVAHGAEFLESDQRVIALGTYSGRARSTGRRFIARFAHVWTLQDGMIVRLQQCADTVQLADALRATEPTASLGQAGP